MFSWRLILTPRHVLDYVVAHEVAHLVHANHGPDFHALLAELDAVAGPRVRMALFRAYFTEHRDVSDIDVLTAASVTLLFLALRRRLTVPQALVLVAALVTLGWPARAGLPVVSAQAPTPARPPAGAHP